ncbi:MAG TPA: hypothetical protein VKB96_02490 [Gammaproteobacteria bacterium]|nr:hypothetical protein [Gammaproteobacteria bacterium]
MAVDGRCTCMDVHARMALAIGTDSYGSRAATNFRALARQVFLRPMIASALTNNGAEFAGRFAQALAGIIH